MRVKLVSTTSSRIEGIENAEEIIVYCARVSNPNRDVGGIKVNVLEIRF